MRRQSSWLTLSVLVVATMLVSGCAEGILTSAARNSVAGFITSVVGSAVSATVAASGG